MGSGIIALIGPWIVRAVSSTVAKAVGIQIAKFVLDRARERLKAAGHADAALLLQDVEDALVANPTPLVMVAQSAVQGNATVVTRS